MISRFNSIIACRVSEQQIVKVNNYLSIQTSYRNHTLHMLLFNEYLSYLFFCKANMHIYSDISLLTFNMNSVHNFPMRIIVLIGDMKK